MSNPKRDETRAAVRALNDALRSGESGDGMIVATEGVRAAGATFLGAVMAAVRRFDAFDADNDPHGEHDFGVVDVEGARVFFKIDYYDPTLTGHSADPADPRLTRRVLTIMLAHEY